MYGTHDACEFDILIPLNMNIYAKQQVKLGNFCNFVCHFDSQKVISFQFAILYFFILVFGIIWSVIMTPWQRFTVYFHELLKNNSSIDSTQSSIFQRNDFNDDFSF